MVVGLATCSVVELVVESSISSSDNACLVAFLVSSDRAGNVVEGLFAVVSAAVIDGVVGPSRLWI